jgi:hypothetical protein
MPLLGRHWIAPRRRPTIVAERKVKRMTTDKAELVARAVNKRAVAIELDRMAPTMSCIADRQCLRNRVQGAERGD